ncbi:MAG: zinc ribbon domain-containing protein [Bacteroidetes bacterium]|nr:zinc ribbon domain-containing protein [Bacteroidota bacterium]
MKCNKCGFENESANKFCTNCSNELIDTYPAADAIVRRILRKCSNCGINNPRSNSFCVKCGNLLNTLRSLEEKKIAGKNRHKVRSKKIKKKKKPKVKTVIFRKKPRVVRTIGIYTLVVIGFLLIVVVFDSLFNKSAKKENKLVEEFSNNPAIELRVREISSKFICSCGTCGEKSLEVCSCDRAIEERKLIRDYLEKSKTEDEIVKVVANTYGWLKAQYASTYKVKQSRTWSPIPIIDSVNQDSIPTVTINRKASFSDRYVIYSAFNCPCGQCSKDELKDCDCRHSNGALEVKNFIDNKIQENKFTTSEIIDLVNKKYGGLKL